MGSSNEDAYVVGLLLALVLASAVPVLAGGALILSLLLLFIVVSQLIQKGILA